MYFFFSVAMATRLLLLLGTWLGLLCGLCTASSRGKEFVTAFLQNSWSSQANPRFELLITGYHPATTVTVTALKSTFYRTLPVSQGQTVSVVLPTSVEMIGTNILDKTVSIQANQDVSVFAFNHRDTTSGATIVYPVQQLGTLYYVVTPMGTLSNSFKEFTVVTYRAPAQVDIHLKGAVVFRNQVYPAGSRLVTNLQAYQAIQLQSSVDLSGTKVKSTEPVAVLSGHSCASKNTACDHVVEQLLPVSSWGTTFIVPPLSFQYRFDIAYVIASQKTCIKYHSGFTQSSRDVIAGQVIQLDVSASHPLYISADVGIQVIFFFTGAPVGSGAYDPFIINMPAVMSYCRLYHIDGIRTFENYAIIIAKTSESSGITLDKRAIENIQWRPIPGTEYSWAQPRLGTEAKSSFLEHPSATFGLLIVGGSYYNGFGSVAPCACGKPVATCSSIQCRKKEKCEMINGEPTCLPESESTCWAQGDPHYHTFDGRNFDFMGTCTYTIAKTCGSDKSLPSFSIEAKNENRGNTHVSYVGSVAVEVYNTTISVTRNEIGFVRVNNQRSRLPISLHDGKLHIYQSGHSVVIQADLSLRVSYDWNSYLVVKISSSFWESICGLCGNYNGNPADDFQTPNGTLTLTPVGFGQSWKVDDGDRFCWDDCHGDCKSCPPEVANKYKAEPFCGWISKGAGGPFSQCHSVIDPNIFLENCVYDLCLNDGFKEVLCEALENYADTCQKAGVAISDWRTPTGCALPCPENSHYKLCGSACAATCNDQAAPSNCSSLPCVETCQCNEGFVLDAGKCIPQAACGCVFEGKLFAPNEQFWGDDTCTRRCLCDPQSRQVTCQVSSCQSGEQCRVENGIQNCYPTSYATCSASGDPHYLSFDGLRFDFQGTCIYQFTGLCEDRTDLVDFRVLVQNEHRGSQSVSFTRAVEISVYDTVIVISRENPGKVTVNGLLTHLPYSTENNKISLYRRGQDAVVHVNFQLTVTFDWQSRVTVTVPSTYAGTLCGLCGNFNGNKQDEMTMQDGGLAPTPSAFGQSWTVREIPGCTEVDTGECSDLSAIERHQRGLRKECGLILDENGPFRECHHKVDPEGYFHDCVYDYCFFEGQQAIICQDIASYVAACQAAGVTIHAWRSETFCSLPCGQHSHYELCARGCPQTCGSFYVPTPCLAKCQESCVCDENFVLSGDQCVPLSQCGCNHQGHYYPVGETFYPTCQERCECQAGGTVTCRAFSCGPYEECRLSDGIRKCHPIGSATCSASGDPHYISFDGFRFDFQGTCTYTLVEASKTNSTLTPFTINVENAAWGNGKVSVTKMVSVEVYNFTLVLMQNKKGQVKVNGLFQPLPVTLSGGQLRVYQHGTKVVIQTGFALLASYDLVYDVRVTVPGSYQNQLGGLCGNYNGRQQDDFLLPDGRVVSDAAVFGAAWKVSIPGASESCSDGCSGNNCPVCEESKKDVFKERHYCGILTAEEGPFSACHNKVNPSVYFSNCIYDLCLGNGDSHVLCKSIESYVSACQEAGLSVQPWRNQSFCPLSCPANSHYEICADLCATSCAKITDPGTCPEICAEGCQCDDGFFFDGLNCVTVGHCGCFWNGRYYRPNEKVLLNDCHQSCTCLPGQGVICEAHSCSTDEKCEIRDGVMGCINKDPCKALKCRPKETCKVENHQATCVPDFTASCWGWGDPHYHTFDGLNFDFQGTCTYIIAKYCGNDSTLVPFSVEEKNDNRGNQAVSYVRLVNIYVYGYKISIHKQETGRIRVNDEITSLPVTLEDGMIRIHSSGLNAVLQTSFGLQVTYDWNWHLTLSIPSSYHESMCGLCGNFNQNPADDMTYLNGTMAPSIVSWASSWKAHDRDPFCWDFCQGNCPTCDDSKRQLYGGQQFCGVIKQTTGGPFRDCHTRVNPDDFFDSCIYDVCLNGGAQNILCQALEAYATTCRKANATVYDWRTPSGCDLPCPENSHYEACGSACPASCSDRTAPSSCQQPCVETCQCNDGFVLSVDQCVPTGSCGCTYDGYYYQPGEEFWADENCGSRCRCDPNLGIVVCRPAGCKANERCTMVNGVRGCNPISFATCLASGDPHYTTFDGKRYDFMGTCIYLLAGLCSSDPTLTPFEVQVQNNNRGNTKVSYTKVVMLKVYNMTLVLSQEYPRQLQVNGVFVNLPFYQEGKVKAYISGDHAFIQTVFDMTINFDWNSYVRVILPNTYTNASCGLCGNNNLNPNDDLIMKDGGQANSISQFAESWKVAEVPGCSIGCTGSDCPACKEAQKDTYKGDHYCGILVKNDGPFKQCHGTIDPVSYFDDCVFDVCQYHGQHNILCNAISTYVAACQAQGIPIDPWRSDSFCSPRCSHDSHYELCGDGCPATCLGLSAPEGCEVSCKEGCYCDAGFILSADQCVPIRDCGCVHQGKYYKKEEEFYPTTSCDVQCRCTSNGVIECRNVSCGAHETCRVENGIQGCHPVSCGQCSVTGGSHYLTFDGQAYDYQGACTYTLAEVHGRDFRLVNFSISVENERSDDGRITLTKTVTVSFHGYTIVLERRKKWQAKVDGEIYTLPLRKGDGKLRIHQEGNNVIVHSDFNLKVLYDTSSYLLISVPSSYRGYMNGLCGNFNRNATDDFRLPNGKTTPNVEEFGTSWKIPVDGADCSDSCGEKCPVCDPTKTAPFRPEDSCGIIQATSGPFRACHSLVAPAEYFNRCLYDMCAANGMGQILCQSLQAYTAACQVAGATVGAWRTDSFCPLPCPPNSHYELCTWTCDFTCTSLSAPVQCAKKCFEGCQCESGYLFSGEACVPIENCGCVHDGRYIQVGDSILLDGCSERCTCGASGTLVCEETSCRLGEICALRNGVRDCVKQKGECILAPGARLTSFDGATREILHKGAYEVASHCNESDPFWFRVIVVIQECSSWDVDAVSTVHVFFREAFITLKKDKEAWVNGHQAQLPVATEDVSISLSEKGVVLNLASEVHVLLRPCGEVLVEVSDRFEGKLCASCGNFNGNPADDMWKVVGNSTEAWKAEDFSGCDS
ncbi:IgGFc-binding protein [Paroedura picta]|uniref:IgGFc-binding protein n=1 Tax=Paroedura picta TaxID=143630 RepID=UPI00405651BF